MRTQRAIALGGLALLVVALVSVPASAEPAWRPHLERVGTGSGPPFEVVTSILQDRAGFMWFGSRDGLTLFDGMAFRVFRHDPSDPNSISDNVIRTIFEDREGRLWIGTNTGGLDVLDRSSWSFRRYRHDGTDPATLSHDSVYAITEDPRGDLWVATQQGLNRMAAGGDRFERFLADPSRPGSLSNNYVTCLLVDRDGRLWVGTQGGGVNRLDPATGRFEAFRHDPSDPASLVNDYVTAFMEDADGRLWVGTNGGLSVKEPARPGFRSYAIGSRDTVGSTVVTSIAEGMPGRIWLGTWGGGLVELDTATGGLRTLRRQRGSPDTLGDDKVLTLLDDAGGTLWVGTWGGGVSRLTRSALSLASAPSEIPEPADLEESDVTALAVDGEGEIWIGMRNGGVLERKPGKNAYRRWDLGGRPMILGILAARDGRIWFGTGHSLLILNPANDTIDVSVHDPADPSSLGPGYVVALYQDREGHIWVGTGEGGLQELDARGRVVRRFLHDPEDPATLSDPYVTAILEDSRGTLWVGTRSGGLNEVDPRTGRVVRHVPGGDGTISHHFVTSILEDRKQRLWVGTGGGGLDRVERDAAGGVRFTAYGSEEGLIDDNVMAILVDDDGSLWLSTKRGLARFDPEGPAFTSLRADDGISTDEFEPGAAARTDRELYFGSVRWVAAVPAGRPFPQSSPSPTVVTSIRSARGEMAGDVPPWRRDRMEIPYGEWFSIDLAVLDYNSAHDHAFAYRLGGAEDPWVDIGAGHEITFTRLEPGVHRFVARGRNCAGAWSESRPPIEISIIPPFWMTTWFRVLAVLGIVGIAVVVHVTRLSAVERRNRELLDLQEQRERAREELRAAYDRLRLLTRRMELAKEEERKRIARELHDDLGPTLTAVIINLQLLGEGPGAAGDARRIDESTELVDRMIQRIRDLSLDLRPPLLDEMGLVAALKGYIETQAERAGISIEVTGDEAVAEIPPEIEIAGFRAVQEAVTNVIRHSRARKATVTVAQRDGSLELAVADDGTGFDVKAILEGPATGKAIGLLGMRERVQVLNGKVEIDSSPGKGTTVRVSIPIEPKP